MTRTDIYNASKSIFPGLPDEETFVADMADSEKASRAFDSALKNKDKYDEMGIALPSSVEEFQAIITDDSKKKSTSQKQGGKGGSTQTQQSNGSKPVQSSQTAPQVFKPKRSFSSAQEIDDYFSYLDQYKKDPNAQKEKIWFEQEYPNITNQFWNQGGKPLTIQGPDYGGKEPSVTYQSNLPKISTKSTIDNSQFLKEDKNKNVIPRMTDEELMSGVINEITPAQDVMQAPINIQQAVIRSEQQSKREQEGAKVKGKSAQEIVSNIEKENFYSDNYPKIESLIKNGFGALSSDIDFTKLNVNNRSELEDAYGKLEQDYFDYLQKTDPQEYERVKNEIEGIRSKKGSDINSGERMVIDQFRSKAMEMHNLVNGYIMNEIQKNYDISGYFGAADSLGIQIDSLDKKIKELNIDPSGKGVSPAKYQQYQTLVDQRNKLVEEYNSLDEKFEIPKEAIAKFQDVANRFLDNSIVSKQLNNLDTELAAKKNENMMAAKKRFDEAMSGDYSIAGELGRTYSGTVGKSVVDLVTTAWDVIGETTGDTDYDIWDEIANFGRSYNFEKEKMFGMAQDIGFEPKEYSDLPLAYRMTGLTGSGLGSVSLSAAGSVLTGAIGLGTTVGGGMLMLGSSLSDNYNEALRNGYSGKEAGYFATTMAGIEMAVESLFPDFKFFENPESKRYLLNAISKSKTPKEAFEIFISTLPKAAAQEFEIAAKNFTKEGVMEEGGSQLISDIVKSKFNEQNKDKGQFEVFKGEDYQNAVLGGFLASESANIIGRIASTKMPHEESTIYQAAINPDILLLADRNSISIPDEMKEVVNAFKDIDDAMKSKPGYDNLSDDQKAHVVSEIQRMKYLEEQNKKIGIDDKATQEEIGNIKAAVEQYIDQARNNPKFKLPQYAIQEKKTLPLLKISNDGKLQINEDFVSKRSQIERGIQNEKEANYSDEETARRVETTGSWLQTIEGGDREEAQNKTNELLGEYLQERKEGGDVSENNDRRRSEISTQGDNGEISEQKTGEVGTRASQERRYNGQQDRESSVIEPSGTLETSYNAEIERGKDKIFKINEAKRESVVKKTRELFGMPFSEKSARISRDLQKMLYEASSNEEKNEIINQIKETLYESLSKPISESVLPRQQGTTTETGGEPQGMGQDAQGEKVTQEGQEVSQEGVTPEQKQIESEEYISKLEKIRDEDPLTFWSVSVPEIKDVKEGTIIKNENGQAVVSKDGDIKALYKNPESEAKNVADSLLKEAIKKGGVKLDNFDIYLTPIYKRNGFRIVSRVPFNKQYAPTGWDEAEHGTPDVVAMVYDPENKLDIEEKQFTDYDEAMAYRDSFIDAQKEAYGDQKASQDEVAKKKSIADIIRGLKSKGGKLYSAGLGIPVAIWDGAVEIIATAVEAGEGLINGINKAKKYLQDQLKDKYNEDVVDELLDNVINQSPIQIQSSSIKGEKVNVNPEGHNLSFVKPEDLIDIESLIKDIESKGEKVWFWVADQLGRGIYSDKTTGNQHFLDAGPSFALDPENRKNGVIWASGMESTAINKNIENADYIFIISGSPTQSKLFNKAVFKLFQDKLGDYKKFKSEVLNAKTTKGIREVLNAHNSWDTLIEDSSTDNTKTKKVGTGRKKMLIELVNAFDKPNSGLYKILESRDALLDINSIRDGFYADNNFDVNDVMLVLKPEKIGGKSKHSTYENDILGEVVGVPDKKIDAYDILPNYLRSEKDVTKVLQTSRIAPYGSGIREVSASEAIERETKSKAEAIRSNKLTEAVEMLSDAEEAGGSEITKAQKEVSEKLGEEGKKIAEIDRNFDKLADDLGFIKTCII